MWKWIEITGAAMLGLIPIASQIAMWEIWVFPDGHRFIGYLIAAYLALVIVLLLREILRDIWRWLTKG